MAWTAYRVTFKLLSPMHIGWRKLGNLQQTRPYVTGRVLWGALTARLTRESTRGAGKDYEDVGKLVDRELAFTYFYPAIKPEEDKKVKKDEQDEKDKLAQVTLWPWGEKWDEFAWKFMGSYASTSLANGRNAEDGSLHETEFIAPHTRGDDSKQVYLVGYIFEKQDGKDRLKRRNVLDRLQFGGERGYGWGRVEPVKEMCKKVEDGKCFDYELDCDHDRPRLVAPREDMHLLAHTDAISEPDKQRGAIEPLLGRVTQAKGFGNDFSNAEICWIPGGNIGQGERFEIGGKGVWRPLSE